MCNCLSAAISNKGELNDEKFDACWSNDSLLIKEVEQYFSQNDSLNLDDETAYKFGKEYFEKNQIRFINECDAFYHFIDSARYNFLNEVMPIKINIQIDSLTKEINEKQNNSELFRLRGLNYFSLMKLKEAKEDFDKALSLPGANAQCLYFRGWIFEIWGRFDEAIADYKLAKESTGITYVDMLIAIADRKKREKNN